MFDDRRNPDVDRDEFDRRSLFQAAVERCRDAVFFADADSRRLLEVNAALERLLGQERSELLSMTLFDVFAHPEDEVDADVERIAGERVISGASRLFRDATGRLVPVTLNAEHLHTPSGRILCLIARDDSEAGRLQAGIARLERRVRALARETCLTERRVRQRLATDLHDRTLQDLGACRLQLLALARKLEAEEAAAVTRTAELLERSIDDTRHLLFDTSPPSLMEAGLVSSLDELARQFTARHSLRCRVDARSPVTELPEDVSFVLYRSVRELLMNVAKHADASEAVVGVNGTGHAIEVFVSDDGRGIVDVDTGGFGLSNIREHILLLGGEVRVSAAPARGTTVFLRVPLHQR